MGIPLQREKTNIWITYHIGFRRCRRDLPFRSIFANSIPPMAVLACCTSINSSAATERCFSKGWLSGVSTIGSIGSNGLIKWAKIHIFGSDTSKTLNGPWFFTSTESHGGGSYTQYTIQWWYNQWWIIHASNAIKVSYRNSSRKKSFQTMNRNYKTVSLQCCQWYWFVATGRQDIPIATETH